MCLSLSAYQFSHRPPRRTNIGDESFNLDIGGLDAAPPPSSSPAKKRKLDSGSSAPVQNPPRTAPRRSPRTRNPYDLPDTSKDSAAQGDDATSNVRPGLQENGRNRASGSAMRSSQPGSGPKSGPLPAQSEPQPDALESLPPPSGAQSIEESPAHAPGSDRRRSLRPGSAVDKRARNLQGGLDHTYSEGSVPMTSSPLVQKTRRSEAAAIVRSVRSIRQTMSRSPGGDEDELSPDRPRRAEVPDSEDIGASAVGDEVGQDELGDDEQAQEIGDAEGLRRSPRGLSPQLGSNDREEASSPKRTRRRPAKSPATRKQRAPKAKSKPQKQPARSKPREQPKKGRPKAPPNRRRNSDDGTAAIELTVQRFVNHKRRGGEDGDDADPLQLDIPFANRTAESAVDVFAQVCDEVIGNTLEQFQEMSNNATEAAKRKEFRVKIRAVEAYREVLNSRLLQHVSLHDNF